MIDVRGLAGRAALEARSVAVLARAGVIAPQRPDRVVATVRALTGFGPFGAIPKIAAIRHAGCVAIDDERGELTYAELERAVDRVAAGLLDRGLRPGDVVGILCRNHRGPLVAAFAASRIGCSAVWLNTSFSARQAAEVAGREGVDLLVADDDLVELVAGVDARHGTVVCSVEGEDGLEALAASASARTIGPPARPGRIVLLTSGTTGTPKGAPRTEPRSLTIPGALLDRLPMRAREATVVAPPLFHGTGLVMTLMTLSLGSRVVLRRRFDPRVLLDDAERTGATTWCLVPIMLQRVLALGEDELAGRDLRALRCVFCAGSQLPPEVARRATDAFGDVVHNLYGSTEVSVATIATPADVREAPTSVGRPALGCRVRILDADGREVPRGEVGRVFVGATSPFEGYTGGGHKEVVDGLMSTGDLGHLDAAGRLHVDGRDDEMIVSGGENVFPREVEDLLLAHPAVAEAAVVGVADEEFGQRLAAHVVLRAPLTEDEVRAYVRDHLARFKVPRDVVLRDELPRNPMGKVRKTEL